MLTEHEVRGGNAQCCCAHCTGGIHASGASSIVDWLTALARGVEICAAGRAIAEMISLGFGNHVRIDANSAAS
jgi:hypothetical protein